ncbi:methionine/alanine import family NSS transporter small subunit [Rothia sp. LK2588]
MTSAAILMLIVAIVTIWGGMVLAIVNLARHPEQPEEPGAVDEYNLHAD